MSPKLKKKLQIDLDKFLGNYYDEIGVPKYIEVAAWVVNWCEDNLVTSLHIKRLQELEEKITQNKVLREQIERYKQRDKKDK